MNMIVPSKVVLSRDECVRSGKYVIGWWRQDYICGSPHGRPSQYEGMLYYQASLNNGQIVDSYSMEGLREEIIDACRDGIEPVEFKTIN